MGKKKDSFFVRVLRDFIHSVPESADEKLQEKKKLAMRVLDRMEMAQGNASTGGEGEILYDCLPRTGWVPLDASESFYDCLPRTGWVPQ